MSSPPMWVAVGASVRPSAPDRQLRRRRRSRAPATRSRAPWPETRRLPRRSRDPARGRSTRCRCAGRPWADSPRGSVARSGARAPHSAAIASWPARDRAGSGPPPERTRPSPGRASPGVCAPGRRSRSRRGQSRHGPAPARTSPGSCRRRRSTAESPRRDRPRRWRAPTSTLGGHGSCRVGSGGRRRSGPRAHRR